MYKIYKLIDPITNEILYIGITKTSLNKRLVGHLHEAFHRTRLFPEKQEWIQNLLDRGLIPKIILIEETKDVLRESYWVNQIKPLYNIIYNKDERFKQIKSVIKSISIYQYDLLGNFIQEWKSASEVDLKLGIDNTNISSCLSGKRQQAGGFMWKLFKTEKINSYRKNIFLKEIHMYNKNGEYLKSFPSARHVNGFGYKGISKCCNGDNKTYKGYKFSFDKKDKI